MRLPQEEARTRLAAARVARLATVDEQGRPHLVPVTFAVRGDVAVTAVDHKPKTSRDLKRLRNIEANPLVSLLADDYAEDWTQLWWVRADGAATILRDPADMAGPLELLTAKYPQYQGRTPAGPVIRIDIGVLTGWHG
ncbi:MAG TPA: TIGR03668 family PPOX class F420-dependent oxidoreductase [Pseudonocardiaceae bacterium]|jgi:PPOX class probable F420-dependent enzyme|nr:TIGR03668 family PPOX class F420-dependent oxidoreductase [Pseudonocardiaceae bacterium]